MANKITRPIKMPDYRVANKRDDYRKNRSPSAQLRRKKQKHLAIGLLCVAAAIGIIGNIVLALKGILLQNSVESLVLVVLYYIPITIALRIFGKLSKWSKILNFFSIIIWVVIILVVDLTLFR